MPCSGVPGSLFEPGLPVHGTNTGNGNMKAKVYVTLKKSVLDPQGKAVQHALSTLGFKEVEDVRVGKYIELDLGAVEKSKAESKIKTMCEKLLANTVIEDFKYELN